MTLPLPPGGVARSMSRCTILPRFPTRGYRKHLERTYPCRRTPSSLCGRCAAIPRGLLGHGTYARRGSRASTAHVEIVPLVAHGGGCTVGARLENFSPRYKHGRPAHGRTAPWPVTIAAGEGGSLNLIAGARRRRGRAPAARTFFLGLRGKNSVQHRGLRWARPKNRSPIRRIVLTNNALRNLLAGGATRRRGPPASAAPVRVARHRGAHLHIYAYIQARAHDRCQNTPSRSAFPRDNRYGDCIRVTMSGNDVKQALRKLDFPYCAREALCRIGTNAIGYLDAAMICLS